MIVVRLLVVLAVGWLLRPGFKDWKSLVELLSER